MYGYMDTLDGQSKSRYKCKLDALGLVDCPYNSPADAWKDNPTEWPEVEYPDIFHYLVNTPGVYTLESMGNYKSLEAHNQFTSGWVQTVYHMEQDGCTILRAEVRPSWRVNEELHHPWVAVKPNGKVISAHCDCMAGLGESCSHVAALLFKIEGAVRFGYTKLACTEKPCEWNKCFVKSVEAAAIADIQFYKETSKERVRKNKRSKPMPGPSTLDEQRAFLQDLATCKRKPVGLLLFKETANRFNFPETNVNMSRLPRPFNSLYNVSNEKLSETELNNKCVETISLMTMSPEEADYLCASTVNQSSCPLWHDYRLGRVTASNAHAVTHTNVDKPAPSLLKKICHPESMPLSTPAIKWGREKEAVALKQYEEGIVSMHDNCTVKSTGLQLCVEKPYIGASPDGIVSCECHGDGVIEIKCPYKYRDLSVSEMVKQPDSCLTTAYELKVNHAYYTQVQLQMHVLNRSYCHFVVWTTENCFITTVLHDARMLTNRIGNSY